MSKKTLSESRRESRAHSRDSRVVRIRTEKNGGALKTMFFALLILVQLSLLLALYYRYIYALQWYLTLSFALSLISAVHVLSTDKNGQAKSIWVFFLMIGFSIGFIAYILSSEKIFFGKASRKYKKIFARTERYTPEYIGNNDLPAEISGDVRFLNKTGGFPAFTDSETVYFPSGAQLFDDVMDCVRKAEKFVFMEFFIVADGILLERLCDVLYKKADEGVDVRLIIDGLGSYGPLSLKTKRKMRKAGIKLYRFNRFIPRFTFATNLRDHRKIIIVDGKTAYTGGCNLADEYINEKRLHGYWKDNGVRVTGRAVDGFTLIFLKQCEFVAGREEDYAPFLNLYEKSENASVVVPYADGKDYKHGIVRGLYTNIMSGAKKKLYIMTPYFVPDDDTMNLIRTKALDGVDVRLILPGIPDKSYVYFVTLDNARRLSKSGVKVYLMRQGFVHSKVVYSENSVSVGSANLDLRSYYNQFENGVYTDDPEFMAAVESDFIKTCALSDGVDKKIVKYPLVNRIVTGLLRLFSPLM